MNDPRTIANYILQTRKHLGRDTTNLEIQKLLFFCYSNYLLSTKEKLCSGYFEAWKYGPVHPIVYRSFSSFKGSTIQSHAEQRDPFTKKPSIIKQIDSAEQREIITGTVSTLAKLTAGQLVDLSHRPNGPWDRIVQKAKSGSVLGMRITDEVIISCSRSAKLVSIDSQLSSNRFEMKSDEVRYYVEEPIAGYGFS